MREAIEIFKVNEDSDIYYYDDNCIIGWDEGMNTYFFYNRNEDLLIGGIDGRRISSVFEILYELIKKGYSFKFWHEDCIDNLINKSK